MSDIHLKLWNEDEPELENDTENDFEIPSSEPRNWKEERLTVLRMLLRKRRAQKDTTRSIAMNEMPRENSGHSKTESVNASNVVSGIVPERKDVEPSLSSDASSGRTASESFPLNPTKPSDLDTAERHLEKLEQSLNAPSPTSEIVASQSMNLLDESANHMFDLMKGLHANQPAADVKAYDPDRVNSAVACANTIYKIMRLKLDAIKVQRKLK